MDVTKTPFADPNDMGEPMLIISMLPSGSVTTGVGSSVDFDDRDAYARFGIILSDCIDHLANAFHQQTGAPKQSAREKLMKHFNIEEKAKKREPGRGNLRGSINRDRAN